MVAGSGYGFNTQTRQLAFPVLNPTAATPISDTYNAVFQFATMDAYMQHIMDESTESNRMGGIFSESKEWIDMFAMAFGDYSGMVHLVQKEYHTHKSTIFLHDTNSSASSIGFTAEFQAMLNMLPPPLEEPFNEHNETHVFLYSMLFRLFGTSVLQESLHGGIMDRVVTVKTCYGGDVSAEMLAEL